MPSSNYPGSLDTSSNQVTPTATTALDASNFEHDQVHGAASTAIIALEAKLGISAAPAASASDPPAQPPPEASHPDPPGPAE